MNPNKSNPVVIDGKAISVSGRFLKTARIDAEYYDFIDDPGCFIRQLLPLFRGASLFTFVQEIGDQQARHPFYHEEESLAVLSVSTYEHWWKNQINDKTRNMIRKAQKSGVELRICTLDDAFVRAIMGIYNECPLRQGKPFKHYGKDFSTIKRDHATFLERSEFIGAFQGEEIIGFIKLVHGRKASSLMQIISKIKWRDTAPTNALISKAVEICAERRIPHLHYGIWSRRGVGEFKKHHGFSQYDVPRYYVPLNLLGHLALKLSLHRELVRYIPQAVHDQLVGLRSRLNQSRYKSLTQKRGSGSIGRAS